MKHNFRELNIWKRSIDLVQNLYVLLAELPNDEKFGLKSQMSRCGVSIPSNIAEGCGRTTDKDFIRFIDYSLASSYELETQLILVKRIFGLDIEKLVTELNEIQKMIGGFKRSL